MKQTILSLAALTLSMTAGAHNELGIQPTTIASGATEATVWVSLGAEDATLRGAILDLQLPEGWTLSTEFATWAQGLEEWTLATPDADRPTHLVAFTTNYNAPFAQSEGQLFSLTLQLPAGTPDGYYPLITLPTSQLAFSGTEGIRWESTEQVSYIKVGQPTEMQTAPGLLLSFAQAAINADQDMKLLDMRATTAINTPAEGFAFVDGRELRVPASKDVVVDRATYSRAVGEGNLASVQLPFTTTEGTFYTLGLYEDAWASYFRQSGLEQGVPAIAEGDIAVSAEDVTLSDDQLAQQATAGYYLESGQLRSAQGVTLAPYRALFSLGEGLRGFSLGTADGIRLLDATQQEGEATYYDLSGRPATRHHRGIVVSGKRGALQLTIDN